MARPKYFPDRDGVRELGRSEGLADVTMDAARGIAAAANTVDPRGRYEAQRAGVTAGWANEFRAGARVVETGYGHGARDRVLARLAAGQGVHTDYWGRGRS